jgi:RHS repeat-associated protein
VLWALSDHLGTIRNVVDYNESSPNFSIANHRTIDSFGRLTAETNSTVDLSFMFTGKLFDEATGLSNHLNRWLDPHLGKWISEDPIGFAGGDANLLRYVGNSPTNFTDPNGFEKWLMPWDPEASWDPRVTFRFWVSHSPSEHLRGLYTCDTDETLWTNEAMYAAGQSYT